MRPVRIRSDGYLERKEPRHPMARASGYVLEHRRIAYNGGLLTDPTKQIHHRNGDRTDNRLENLEILTVDEHTRLHLQAAGVVRNQFGVWPLMTCEERLEKGRARSREAMRIREGFYERHPDAEPAFLPLYERHFGAVA